MEKGGRVGARSPGDREWVVKLLDRDLTEYLQLTSNFNRVLVCYKLVRSKAVDFNCNNQQVTVLMLYLSGKII